MGITAFQESKARSSDKAIDPFQTEKFRTGQDQYGKGT